MPNENNTLYVRLTEGDPGRTLWEASTFTTPDRPVADALRELADQHEDASTDGLALAAEAVLRDARERNAHRATDLAGTVQVGTDALQRLDKALRGEQTA